jgi:hypothetical protein
MVGFSKILTSMNQESVFFAFVVCLLVASFLIEVTKNGLTSRRNLGAHAE